MSEFTGKKLLILGGTPQQCKLVTAARGLGAYTIVADYLPRSAAKAISDGAWDVDIFHVEELARRCREERVDGVICGFIDPCQRPYQQLCRILDLPCYGTAEQFRQLTDKHAFKTLCRQWGVDVIEEYTPDGAIEYPVFVKPVDSRGSRGQSICRDAAALPAAIELARQESSNGDILIERYMEGAREFQVTYFFVDGKAYLLRTADSYSGTAENHLQKVVSCAVSPSQFTQLYLETAHRKVEQMFLGMGLRNGPAFLQGFVWQDRFRFFDPGLRFPGVDYEMIYREVFGTDLAEAMVRFALSGSFGSLTLPEAGYALKGKRAAVLFPTLRAGTVGQIRGLEAVKSHPSVISCLLRCGPGDTIGWHYNVNQRMAEIDILAEDTEALRAAVDFAQHTLIAVDTSGSDMTLEHFDTRRIR